MKASLLDRWNEFRRRTGFQWGGGEIVVAAILIFGILSMGSGMFGKWLRDTRQGGLLMVDLHSFSSANYGVDEMPVSVPAIGLEIIQDLLGVNEPPETGRADGVALVSSPTPTPTAALPFVGGTSISPPTGGTATSPPSASATPVTNHTPTSTPAVPTGTETTEEPPPTLQPPDTAVPSPTRASATSTPEPTLPPSPTNTPLPSPAPPTSTPPPSPTPQPVNSPTPRPTRSSTLAVTPTADYTPVVNPGTPVIP